MSTRDHLTALRAELHSAAEHRRAAELLRREAARLEQLADAIERSGQPLADGKRHGRKPGAHIAIVSEARSGYPDRVRVVIGKALWYALRASITNDKVLDAQRVALRWGAAGAWLEPCGWGDGYAVTIGSGAPRFYAGPDAREHLPPDGRYAGRIESGRLYFE